MSPVAPRTVGLAVAVAASLAAAAGLVVGAVTRPASRRTRARSGEFGIHKVPARPPLWDARPSTGPILTVPGFREAATVGPEDKHAPAER
jgi:hypothetical protein